jgi:pimeloyl-ACP methyl ester carboxylesterase
VAVRQEKAVDGFRLAYERAGSGPGSPAVLLLHGWPGDRTDYREVVPLLSGADVVTPDLRGFGESDKYQAEPGRQYTAVAQARSLIALIAELALNQPVLAGYDIGSRIARATAAERPDLVRALVIAPPLPGIGDRILQPRAQQEFWYQAFHRLELCRELIDGQPEAVRAYLRYFWSHWSGPDYEVTGDHLDHLVSVYGPPGAFAASIAWYQQERDRWRPRSPSALRIPDAGSRYRPRCCGRNTIRCSPGNGPTGSVSSLPRPG